MIISIQAVIFSLIILLISFSADAQMMRMNREERAAELKKKIGLSDEQTKQVKQIYINAENEIKSKVQGSGNREQMREAMETIRSNTDSEILMILNDEQKEKYNEIIQERKERIPGKPKDFN